MQLQASTDLTSKSETVAMSEQEALINRSESDTQPRFADVFEQQIRPCLTEFVGVTLFVFVGTTAACALTSLEGIALAHGLTIALLVIATGSISGAHLNPAVTLGVWIGGAITPLLAALYVMSQCIGAILGAAFTMGVCGSSVFSSHNGGGHALPDDSSASQAVLCEILLTILLVTIVLVAAVDPDTKNSLAPVAIGFAVTVDILAGGTFSGASMNPARSFGPAVVLNKSVLWDYHWIYWVGPLTGAAIAGFIYRLLLAGREKRIIPLVLPRMWWM